MATHFPRTDFFDAQISAQRRSRRWLLVLMAIYAGVIGFFSLCLFGVASIFLPPTGQPRQGGPPGLDMPVTNHGVPDLTGQWLVLAWCVTAVCAVFAWFVWSRWRELRRGGCVVALSLGARRLAPGATAPLEHRLLNVVEEMALACGQPVPAVFVLDKESAENAFAIGLEAHDAALVVTDGALKNFSRDELQAVIAHEFSHLLSGDTRLNLSVTALLAGLVAVFTHASISIMNSKQSKARSIGEFLLGLLFKILLSLLVAGLGACIYALGRLVQAAICRQRELLADAAAVQFTRNPRALLTALERNAGERFTPLKKAPLAGEFGHFLFAPAKRPARRAFLAWWDTHPSFAARIAAVRQIGGLPASSEAPSSTVRPNLTERPRTAPPARTPRAPSPPQEHPAILAAPPPPPAPAEAPAGIAPQLAATAGTLTAGHLADATSLLATLPPLLLDAVRSEALAPAVVYTLLLDPDATVRQRQVAVLNASASPTVQSAVATFSLAVADLPPAARLPLVQLALPALKLLPSAERESLRQLLRQLVEADAQVSVFEFALQRLVDQALAAAAAPGRGHFAHYHSLQGVARDVAVLLTTLARVMDSAEPAPAFAAGARSLEPTLTGLTVLPAADCGHAALTRALNRLALTTPPIKQRVLAAAVHVVCADSVVDLAEFELLRAIAATLEVPMPLLSPGAVS